MNMYYGIFILGPSGSGKSTFCNAISQFFQAIKRKHLLINLDPANDNIPYESSIDLKELIKIDEVMSELKLGPNGALVYCFDFLEKNIEWLIKKIEMNKDCYLIFDLPGQIELYMNNASLKKILSTLQNNDSFNIALTTVSLFDCLSCYDKFNYISTSILALIAQTNLETPHINVFTKIDLLKDYGRLPYRLSSYFDGSVLDSIGEELNQAKSAFELRYAELNKKMIETISDSNLISFYPCLIHDKLNMSRIVSTIDRANGYYFYIENSKEKFSDLRDAIFEFEERDQEEFIESLEEQMNFTQ